MYLYHIRIRGRRIGLKTYEQGVFCWFYFFFVSHFVEDLRVKFKLYATRTNQGDFYLITVSECNGTRRRSLRTEINYNGN